MVAPESLVRGVRLTFLAGAAALVAEAAWAVLRPAPRLPEFDSSGRFGVLEGPQLRMVMLGDSTLTAPGVAHPDQIWSRLLATRIAQLVPVELHLLAEGGSKASDLIDAQLDPALAIRPDLAVISIGANDMLRGVPVRVFERHLEVVVERLAEVSGLVLLSGIGDLGTIPRLLPPLRHYMTVRSRAGNAAHLRVAARHGAVVADQWGWSRGRFQTDPALFSADHFHASEAGHAVWAEVAWEALEPHLDRLLARLISST